MILYRHADRRYPFLWEVADQPAARWNRDGGGPVQYLADTPYGAWAEFLRHEEITDPSDLAGVSRALWSVDVDTTVEQLHTPALSDEVLVGGLSCYSACQAEAERLSEAGATGLRAPSAALKPGGATGHRVDGSLCAGPARDGDVIVLFGARPAVVGWPVVKDGRPAADLLERIRYP